MGSSTSERAPRAGADRLRWAYAQVRERLTDERNAAGHWTGELSTSALSTATAISAMALMQRHGCTAGEQVEPNIQAGLRWLSAHVNEDGGWGDTTKSYTNIATTMLATAAIRIAGRESSMQGIVDRAEAAIDKLGRLDGLRARYGKDKTFAVPILTNCALAGTCRWQDISPLPFELACLPQSWYRFAQLPVVSYAIPALVAIGQARHYHQPSPWPWVRWLRRLSVEPSLRVLRRMQPASGGYLEAVPLTSFVVMSLAAMGRVDHPVAENGLRFILDSMRPDGSWPIDTNLATWNTTLAINALAGAGESIGELECWDWVLSCQHRQRHPFTGAEPGGWGWTDLSGAVPDADDTPSALLALRAGYDQWEDPTRRETVRTAATSAVRWLLKLQNGDGGWPTFCRGWGKLPFDRSGSDLTAHAMRALLAWRAELAPQGDVTEKRIRAAVARGERYLARQQRADGSWIPLWFGNQDHPQEENPIYGTAKVLFYYRDSGQVEAGSSRRGLAFVAGEQNEDGGWGDGESSVEETSLATEALLGSHEYKQAAQAGLEWLVRAVEAGQIAEDSPIGFYFAKLWYHERLYPLVFAASALGRAVCAGEGSRSARSPEDWGQ